MNIRVLMAAAACATLLGCASSQASRLAPSVASANTARAASRVYKQTYTPRTSTPQPNRQPAWPAERYRAPAVQPYAATPRARPVARPVAARVPMANTAFGAGAYGRLPAPQPPSLGSTSRVPAPLTARSSALVPMRSPAATPFAAGSLLPPAATPVITSVPAIRGVTPAIRPARRTPVVPFISQPAPALVNKPIAPVRTGSLFKRSGSFRPSTRGGGLSGILRPRGAASGRDCRT